MKRQSGGIDIEALREIFGSKTVSIEQALVQKVEVALDGSKTRALCKIVPEEYEVVAEVTFGGTGPDAGFFPGIPVPNDLVLVAFTDPDNAFVISRLTSSEDTIPLLAQMGHLVAKALSGKNAHLISDSEAYVSAPQVFIGQGGLINPDEPLVLANVLMSALSDLIAEFNDALGKVITGPVGVGNLGSPVPTDPALITSLTAIQVNLATLESKYITAPATNIASQTAFTER